MQTNEVPAYRSSGRPPLFPVPFDGEDTLAVQAALGFLSFPFLRAPPSVLSGYFLVHCAPSSGRAQVSYSFPTSLCSDLSKGPFSFPPTMLLRRMADEPREPKSRLLAPTAPHCPSYPCHLPCQSPFPPPFSSRCLVGQGCNAPYPDSCCLSG